MKKEELKERLVEIKKHLDENSLAYDRILYNSRQGYCILFDATRLVLGKKFKKAVNNISFLAENETIKI